MLSPIRALGAFAAVALAITAAGGSRASGVSSAQSSVTIYGASWCSACRNLEAKLQKRDVPFDKIDVDQNRDAYERARNASGMGSGIPLTHIHRDGDKWVQGDDADAVEHAYRGD